MITSELLEKYKAHYGVQSSADAKIITELIAEIECSKRRQYSEEFFNYAHTQVSGEYAGFPIYHALMLEHRDLKNKLAIARKSIDTVHGMMSAEDIPDDVSVQIVEIFNKTVRLLDV